MIEAAGRANATPWDNIAFAKLRNVLGEEKAGAVMEQGMERISLRSLRTADDLYRFAQAVTELGGFTAAVGALLSLHAVMNGADGMNR